MSSSAPTDTAAGWQTLTALPTPRTEVAVAALDGKIYVAGGYAADGSTLDIVEVYDPAVDGWTTAALLPAGRNHMGLTTLGGRNFERLLTLRVLPLQPVVGEDGTTTYPAVREFTRNNPAYPQLAGLQEWFAWTIGATRWVVLAGDAVFMKSLANTLFFAVVVVPLQGGLGLLLALLVNSRTAGVGWVRVAGGGPRCYDGAAHPRAAQWIAC